MKKIKLLFAAMAAMVGLSANAQSWIASEVGAGNFHLYNIGKNQFLTRGNGWGTQASAGASALTLIVEEYNGAYKLRTNVNGDGKGLERLSDPVIYTDQSANKNSTWTFTKVADASNGPVYTIVSKDNHGGGAGSYMTASADNTIVGPADAVTDDYGRWQLVQSWITNTMPVINADGWTVSQDPTFDGGNICAEYWNKSGASIKQTVSSLPAGSYELIAVALTREGMTATLNAGSNTKSIATVASSTVNGRGQAKSWFDEGNGVTKLEFTHAGGDLEIGLTADNTTGDHWLVWRSFVLLYKGLDLSEFAATLASAVSEAEALNGTIPTAAYNALAAVVTEQNKTYTTPAAYTAAADAIVEATNAAKALVAPYAAYKAAAENAAIAGVASATISEQDTAVEEATTVAAIEACTATLQAAIDALAFDITTFTIKNPTAQTKTDWEGTDFGTKSDGVCEYWGVSGADFHQTVSLPAGTYRLTVVALQRTGMTGVVYAGENKTTIAQVSNSVVNNRGQAATWFNAGNGKNYVYFTLAADADVTIGLTADASVGDHWTVWQSFKLDTFQESIAASYLAPGFTTLVESAQATHDDAEYANVTGEERTALETAIAASPSTVAEYEAAVDALNNAVAAFTAAKTNYDLYVAEKVNAERISSTITSSITEPTTAAEAVTAFHAILVGEYNYVKDNFNSNAAVKYGMTIDQWTGTATSNGTADTPQTNSNEKWGDAATTYYEQGKNGWSASAWTLNYSITKTLPVGSYVLKIAARASSGTTATLKATVDGTDYYEDLPNFGSTGKGITTAGVASFDDNDTFARDNNAGYGWQWRYLFFYVATEGEVTLQIDASADSEHQWCSFGDVALISNVNLTALTNAYLNFKMDKTLGFQKDEYAPYANADLLQAYADAHDILYEVTEAEDQAQVDGLAATLNAAAWVQNADDVDAIYNGNFAVANGTNPKGWTRSNNGWGQQITGLTAEDNSVAAGTTTAWYYNTNGSWQYGNDGVYTMPLAANQAYELSFKYRKHGSDKQNWMKASVLNSSDEGMEVVEFAAAEDGTTFVTAKAYFTTSAAGNYILSIEQNGNAHLTDVSLVKAADATLALSDASDYTPTDRVYYEEVNLTRTIKAGYNTVCLPFDMTAEQVSDVFGTSAVVYEYEDVASGTSSTINFTPKTGNTIDANVPVLVGSATASVAPHEFTINGVVLKSGEAKVAGTNFDFVGVYDAMTIPSGDCFIGNGALYKSEGSTTIKPFRAYIHDKSGSGVKPILFIDDIETSIEEINGMEAENGVIYNLAGQRISKVQKGINIINGRKVLY